MITIYVGKDIYKKIPNVNDYYIPESKMNIDERLKLVNEIVKNNISAVIYTNCDFIIRHINLFYMTTKENHNFYSLDENGIPFKNESGENYYDSEISYIFSVSPEFKYKLLRKDIKIFDLSDNNSKEIFADNYGFTIDYIDNIIHKQNELQCRMNWEFM